MLHQPITSIKRLAMKREANSKAQQKQQQMRSSFLKLIEKKKTNYKHI